MGEPRDLPVACNSRGRIDVCAGNYADSMPSDMWGKPKKSPQQWNLSLPPFCQSWYDIGNQQWVRTFSHVAGSLPTLYFILSGQWSSMVGFIHSLPVSKVMPRLGGATVWGSPSDFADTVPLISFVLSSLRPSLWHWTKRSHGHSLQRTCSWRQAFTWKCYPGIYSTRLCTELVSQIWWWFHKSRLKGGFNVALKMQIQIQVTDKSPDDGPWACAFLTNSKISVCWNWKTANQSHLGVDTGNANGFLFRLHLATCYSVAWLSVTRIGEQGRVLQAWQLSYNWSGCSRCCQSAGQPLYEFLDCYTSSAQTQPMKKTPALQADLSSDSPFLWVHTYRCPFFSNFFVVIGNTLVHSVSEKKENGLGLCYKQVLFFA